MIDGLCYEARRAVLVRVKCLCARCHETLIYLFALPRGTVFRPTPHSGSIACER